MKSFAVQTFLQPLMSSSRESGLILEKSGMGIPKFLVFHTFLVKKMIKFLLNEVVNYIKMYFYLLYLLYE